MALILHTGLLRDPVTFKQPVSSLNDEGGQEMTFTDSISTMAFVTNFNERRVSEAHASALIGSVDFYIRWATAREAINKDWLITYNSLDYTIHEIESINQRQKWIRYTAKVRTDG